MFTKKWPPLPEMQELGKIHTDILKRLKQAIKPGISAIEIESLFIKLSKKYNVRSACLGKKVRGARPYPANLCISINSEAIHVYPTKEQIFKEGDLVTVDLVLEKNGVYTDAAFTTLLYSTDKSLFQRREKMLNIAYKALRAGINQAINGNKTGDIGYAISQIVYNNGYTVLTEYGGHGIGYDMWEDPFVPNYGEKGQGSRLRTGMYLAIEPLICEKSNSLEYLDDWRTITMDKGDFIQVEATVMVGQSAPIMITEIV